MDEGIKHQWVEALRSGNYTQGKHSLHRTTRDGDVYCCLGVLCDVVGVTWSVIDTVEIRHATYAGEVTWAADTGTDRHPSHLSLPTGVAEKVGINEDWTLDQLANMNDRGLGFHHIADYIEREL